MKIWTEFKKRMRSNVRCAKSDRSSEKEKDSLFEGIKKLLYDFTEKNKSNIKKVVGVLNKKKDKW